MSLNVRDRLHWGAKKRYRDKLAQEVMVAIGGPRYFPRPPLERARVEVTRYSHKRLDRDNLFASGKALCDVLCAKSATHPAGLGIIVDDDEGHCDLVCVQDKGTPATLVIIKSL